MSGRPRSQVSGWVSAVAIIGLTLVAYAPVLQGGFVWDDDAYVTANRTLRTVDGLRRIWFEPGATPQYYPLVFTSFWVEYRLWGLAPFGYHLVNVLLHATTAVLLWRILVGLALPGAWVAAALFALHPVQVESVAWITERKNVLSGLLYMMAALLYLRSSGHSAVGSRELAHQLEERPLLRHPREGGDPSDRRKPVKRMDSRLRGNDRLGKSPEIMCKAGSRQWDPVGYALAVACFLAALLSKTVTCSLPAALLLVAWWQRGRVTWTDLRPLLPFFLLGAGLALVTVRLEQAHVGAVGSDWDLTLAERCLIAGRALWFYAAKLLWPASLTFVYPRWTLDTTSWWQLGFPLAAATVVIALFVLRHRLGRGPVTAVWFFAGTLVPALGFFDVFPMRYSFVADHFQYLACIGLLALTVAGCARWLAHRNAQLGPILAGLVLSACSVLTVRQGLAYVDVETLWRDTLVKNPSAWMAHNNLGLVLLARGDRSGALQHFRTALQIKSDDAYAHNNIGNVLAREGTLDEALEHFRTAARIEPHNAEAHGNIGNVLAAQGDWEGAIAALSEALRIKPRYADAHSNLGNVLVLQGRSSEAMEHYRAALAIDPDFAGAHHNLGVLLIQAGNVDAAMAHWRAALAANPSGADSHVSLGLVLAERGQLDEAARHFEAALRIRPDHEIARQQLEAIRRSGR